MMQIVLKRSLEIGWNTTKITMMNMKQIIFVIRMEKLLRLVLQQRTMNNSDKYTNSIQEREENIMSKHFLDLEIGDRVICLDGKQFCSNR